MSVVFPVATWTPPYASVEPTHPMRRRSQPRQKSSSAGPMTVARRRAISSFGLIQHKLAEMAIRIFAVESMVWRVVGQIESQLEGFSWSQPDAPRTYLKAVEEFAAECSIIKVYASEMLDYVADEGVQIHGGYGFHQDYRVERVYRDARINRIFEGTNEINRLLTTGMLFKRAQKGRLGLVKAAQAVMADIVAGPAIPDAPEHEQLVRNARKIVLLLMGVAYQKYVADLDKQQEVVAGITDALTEAFAMETVWLRSRRLEREQSADICEVFLRDAMARIETTARTVLGACAEGDTLRTHMAVLRRFAKYQPADAIAARRRIAGRLLAAGKYTS